MNDCRKATNLEHFGIIIREEGKGRGGGETRIWDGGMGRWEGTTGWDKG